MGYDWEYITPEQGAIIDSICNEFFDHLTSDGCEHCPLFEACNDISIHCMEEPERTKTFELKLWELAVKATS